MAVEVNKRKRKHDDSAPQEQDEGAVEVPKKQSKKSLTPKKEKQKKSLNKTDESMDDSQQDSGFDAEEKEIKFSKDFKMMEFRTKLRGDNFITGCKMFVLLNIYISLINILFNLQNYATFCT